MNKFKDFLNKYGAYIAAAFIFVTLTLLYCLPALEGKVLQQGDTIQWKCMSHELKEYNETADTPANWTNSMFGGMPGYQITMKNPGNPLTDVVWAVDRFFRGLTTLWFNSVLALLLGYFIGFFLMMRAFGIEKWLSIVGAVAVSMSSYFFLIIPAGHETKALTLGMMAPVIGGFFLIFRKKYGWGAALVMLYTSIGMMKHPQMSYYIFMMLGLFGIAEIWIHIREKRLKDLGIAVAVFALAVGVGVGTSYSTLKANSEYMKETMRGGHSDLVLSAEPSKGLDLDYATAWSYGIDETLTLMIPNCMGGSTNYNLGKKSPLYDTLVSAGVNRGYASELVSSLPAYWGEQPFTAGPVYVGAIVCFLFLLGCLIVKGPYKWALLAATIFSVALSWGHNWMGLTELFYKYFPFYNKFRTVSSILVVAEIAMPLLGFLALKAVADARRSQEWKSLRPKYMKSLVIAAGVTGGICLIFALFGGSICSFSSSYDARTLGGMPKWFMNALYDQRAAMLSADAWRSFIFIDLAAGALALHLSDKLKYAPFVAVVGVLTLADLWPVNKRYFGEDKWIGRKENDAYFKMRPYEKQILQDKGVFRVMNLTTDTFNDARTSYYFHSVGGYHAAKLRRYQDLIDEHLSKGNMEVLNMLNTKYFIQEVDGQAQPVPNPGAFGNAWFVDEVTYVDTPRAESDALKVLDLRHHAVADSRFASSSESMKPGAEASIVLTSYAPDRLEYHSDSDVPATAVFSEIYYPYGWKAYIDGVAAPHFRADYVLRAMAVPAGEHDIVFEFRPDSLYKGYRVNAVFKALMYIFIGLLIAGCVSRALGKGPVWLRRMGAE